MENKEKKLTFTAKLSAFVSVLGWCIVAASLIYFISAEKYNRLPEVLLVSGYLFFGGLFFIIVAEILRVLDRIERNTRK